MQGAAGGSGIAALAQAMANQGQLATQRASASIGMQEGRIQQLRAGEASRLQLQERRGEVYAEGQRLAGADAARGLEWSKTGTLLGMSQQRTASANEARRQAAAQQMSAVGDLASAGAQMATAGMKMGPSSGRAMPVDQDQMRQSYIDPMDAAVANRQSQFQMMQGNAPNTALNAGYRGNINLLPTDQDGNPIF